MPFLIPEWEEPIEESEIGALQLSDDEIKTNEARRKILSELGLQDHATFGDVRRRREELKKEQEK